MKATETRLNILLSEVDRKFSIPIYQRKYSWTEKQCNVLLDDIIKISSKDSMHGHFIGSIVCYQIQDEVMPGVILEKVVIDGQQRLTTMSLIMIALARAYKNHIENGQYTYDFIMRNYIINEHQTGENKYKLVPTYDDKEVYFAIVEEREKELNIKSSQLLHNFQIFSDYLEDNLDQLESIYKGINKLDLVYIVLTKNQDNPQLIFESMNSTGLNLSQGDLLRNYLLLDADSKTQEYLYETYWKPIEQDFGNEDYVERFDYFLRDYLTMLERKTIRLDSGYEEFKDYYSNYNYTKEEILSNLRKFSKYFSRIYRCNDKDIELNELWKELKIQRVEVANPFLMQIYNDYETAQTTNEFEFSKYDFIDIVKAINSYVFRRYIVGIPTNSLNKTFAVLYNSINKSDYKNSVLATLILLESYKEFPDDIEFEEAFKTKDMYNLRLKNYILAKLENNEHLNKIKIDGTDISIEHILPETPVLNSYWQGILGENWKELQRINVHRIGNLTITKGVYNSKMRDYPFKKKLEVEGGIKDSHYRLSNDIVDKEKWDIEEINSRSSSLAKIAVKVWEYPKLTDEQLKPYKNINKNEKTIYENIDHLPTMKDNIQNTYETYDKFIMSLDDKITKIITKHYIAYKYDYCNFAEIIIYKNLIWIHLDIPPELLNDEKKLAENVTDKGSWGTGKNRLYIYNLDDYDYICNLIKQSLNYEKDSE